VSIIQTSNYGEVAYIAIGATCVGSIIMTSFQGDSVTKGQEMGYFQFGGSTIILLFKNNTMIFDPDISYNTLQGVETLVNMGSQVATQL
jgi:phosphatidylserine decarboxylase